MTSKSLPIGPWMGMDNVHNAGARVFQNPGPKDPRLAALAAATDVDLDDDGWVATRPPLGSVAALVAAEGGWERGGRLWVQDEGVLYERVSSAFVSRVTGLVRRAALCEHNGLIYGSDGTTHFEIEGTTVRTWGLPVPAITVATAAGTTIASGTYRVQVAFTDARGNEGPVCDAKPVTLSAAGAILVGLGAGSTGLATHANIYIGRNNQPLTSFVAKVALASLPYTATSVTVTAGDIPVTDFMQGPPAGLVGIVSFRAYLMAWRDDTLFRSEPQEAHLFYMRNNLPFNGTVMAVEGLSGPSGGLWVATSAGVVWVSGEDPARFIPSVKSSSPAAKGSMLLPGHLLPAVQTSEIVALFLTEEGLVAGLPGGTLLRLTNKHYKFSSATRASLAYVERNGLRQIAIALVEG